jgi:hypothetical protein
MAKPPVLQLEVLPGNFGIYRFDPAEPVPAAVLASPFFSVCRTDDELSIVCGEDVGLKSPRSEAGWSCIKVLGPLDFNLTGVLAHLAGLLAGAGISLFALSTFDTDYILVKSDQLTLAVEALKQGGCRFA